MSNKEFCSVLDTFLYLSRIIKTVIFYRLAPFTRLKRSNPQLKTLVSVGGWNMGSLPFMSLVANEATMRALAANAVTVSFYSFFLILFLLLEKSYLSKNTK